MRTFLPAFSGRLNEGETIPKTIARCDNLEARACAYAFGSVIHGVNSFLGKAADMDRPKKNAFEGMSTLRAAEKAKQPPSEKAKALQDYLKKYTDGEDKGKYNDLDNLGVVVNYTAHNAMQRFSAAFPSSQHCAAGQAPQKKRKKKSAVSSQRTFTIIDGDTTGFKSLNRKTAKAAPAAEELSGDEGDGRRQLASLAIASKIVECKERHALPTCPETNMYVQMTQSSPTRRKQSCTNDWQRR